LSWDWLFLTFKDFQLELFLIEIKILIDKELASGKLWRNAGEGILRAEIWGLNWKGPVSLVQEIRVDNLDNANSFVRKIKTAIFYYSDILSFDLPIK